MGILSSFSVKKSVNSAPANLCGIIIDDETRKKLQTALLSMYLDVEKACRKNDIQIYLCGGSAIGAVRHQGFIPWDDDMDTAMSRTDYEKFKSIFDSELADKYILVAPDLKTGSRSRFPKVMKKNTVFREIWNSAPREQCGLCLDIFIIENVPDNPLMRTAKGVLCNGLEFIGGQVLFWEENSKEFLFALKSAGKVQYMFRRAVAFCFSFRRAADWNRMIDRVNKGKKEWTCYCSIPAGRGHYFGEMLPKEVFFPGIEGTFEGHQVLLFQDVDRYLTNLYGDYMKIPKKEERESHMVKELWLGE